MEAKDLILQAGVVVTLALGLVNLYYNLKAGKRATFINTVTSERVKWITKFRDNISILCATCDQWMHHRTQSNTPDLQEKIESIKIEVRLKLNPQDEDDIEIERLLARLPSWTNSISIDEYHQLQVELVAATQRMLKREWDKVKDESVDGDLRHSFRRWR